MNHRGRRVLACCLVTRGDSSGPWQGRRFKPKDASSRDRIHSSFWAPRPFISAGMELTMMRATERHSELVAHFATERTSLREAQMVWIGGPATADQARLLSHMPDMITVTDATRFGEAKHTF